MKLTWLGHACFLLEQDGYRIVTDPYTGVEGYPPLAVSAHEVVCSHRHFDHDAVERVEPLPERVSPFAVRETETCHDDQGGALRGTNTVRIFTAGGVSVAHLGDLGHQLTAEQLAAIGAVDAV
ncbi:MAG: MBL fold metallo-hydrolase, partial [Oscillospiraceae bacterium]|nr:MBL fold metallo-hydrolase [Oscillospiraceae bacterium]